MPRSTAMLPRARHLAHSVSSIIPRRVHSAVQHPTQRPPRLTPRGNRPRIRTRRRRAMARKRRRRQLRNPAKTSSISLRHHRHHLPSQSIPSRPLSSSSHSRSTRRKSSSSLSARTATSRAWAATTSRPLPLYRGSPPRRRSHRHPSLSHRLLSLRRQLLARSAHAHRSPSPLRPKSPPRRQRSPHRRRLNAIRTPTSPSFPA